MQKPLTEIEDHARREAADDGRPRLNDVAASRHRDKAHQRAVAQAHQVPCLLAPEPVQQRGNAARRARQRCAHSGTGGHAAIRLIRDDQHTAGVEAIPAKPCSGKQPNALQCTS
jgi:hypothetical protein